MNPDTVQGLSNLKYVELHTYHISTYCAYYCRPEDQSKIRLAVGLRRVDPADIPASANAPVAASAAPSTPGPSQKKRKAAFEAVGATASPSRTRAPASAQPVRHIVEPTATQIAEDEAVEEVAQDESVDELIVSMRASIVGVQYYKGGS